MEFLRVEGLAKSFAAPRGGPPFVVFDQVHFSIDKGEFVCIVGHSGCGKSTILNILAGLDEPDGGVVRISGERLSRRPEQERARVRAGSIGMLFQSANLVPHMSVSGNVRLAQQLAGRADAARAAKCGSSAVWRW